jgi:hypothetical protein
MFKIKTPSEIPKLYNLDRFIELDVSKVIPQEM